MSAMNWNSLDKIDQIKKIKEESRDKAVLIFKHSTRCNISRTTLDRLERSWKDEEMKEVKTYFLDLLSYRAISNQIADEFDVEHESPQVLIIRDEKPLYHRSHFEIDYTQIKEAVRV